MTTCEEMAREIVDTVHDNLYGREGFGRWWDSIDVQVAEEIMDALNGAVEKVLKENRG